MKKSFLTIVCTFMALGLWASPVTPEMAKSAANAWVQKNSQFGAVGAAGAVRTVCDTNAVKTVLWHQVSMSNGGMLVVAPVTEIEPVLVALEDDPGELPDSHVLRSILSMDMRRRLRLLGLYVEDKAGASLKSVGVPKPSAGGEAETAEAAAIRAWGAEQKAKWARLGVGTGASLKEAQTGGIKDIAVEIGVVDGFEQGGRFTHWNQSSAGGGVCYNYYTPNNAVCGCVATACSALIQAFGTTNSVAGLSAKGCRYKDAPYLEMVAAGKVAAPGGSKTTLGGAIDWNILPKNYGGTNETSTALSDEQRRLLGRVAFDAGVGVSMMWDMLDGSGSGAFEKNMVVALKEVFGFKNARAMGCSGTREEFSKLVWNQCWCGRPVGLGISSDAGRGGHSVLAVGYGKDADGIDRVRIFCGWGGRGDGWYALPFIQTEGTLNGARVNYNIVDEVVTMISLDDDKVVPVVGHVSNPGAVLEVPGLSQTIYADENGYFGVLVPPTLADCRLVCDEQEVEFEIGDAAATGTSADELLPALPSMLEISLMNCSVAYTFDQAKRLALAEGKAILRVSGILDDPLTQAVLDRINELDEANENGFSDRFVYFFSQADSADLTRGDGKPSFGVFLPQATEKEDRWMATEGRLSYGEVVIKELPVPEDYYQEDEEAAGGTMTVVEVQTMLKGRDAIKNILKDVPEEDVLPALLECFQMVIDEGWDLFLRETSGIVLTVKSSTGKEEGSPLPLPEFGIHTSVYTNGEVVTATSYTEITNAVQGVVMGCSGWTLTNETTGVFLSGTGNEASIAMASNDVWTLTWQMDKTNAVYLVFNINDYDGSGTLSHESGWYAFGTPVVVTATPDDGAVFAGWSAIGYGSMFADAVEMGASLMVGATQPKEYVAKFGEGKAPVVTETNTLVVLSRIYDPALSDWVWAADVGVDVPTTVVHGLPGFEDAEIEDYDELELPATKFGVAPKTNIFTTSDGRKMEFVQAELYKFVRDGEVIVLDGKPDVSSLPGMTVSLTADKIVLWYWAPVEEKEVDQLEISWNDTLDNLSESYTTNLLTNAQFAATGMTLEQLQSKVIVPTGWKAKLTQDTEGNVVGSLLLDEETLAPVAPAGEPLLTILPNGDGSVTVKASIANGVKGFWYSLVASDDLATWKAVASGEYDSGTPSEQALQTQPVELSIDVTPADAKKFYKIVVTVKNPVTE